MFDICYGGASIQVMKIALDHVEVAIHHHDDSRGVVENTISWSRLWHEVVYGVVFVPAFI